MTYTDSSGLLRKYGNEFAEATPIGEYRSPGSRRWMEVNLIYSAQPSNFPLVADNSVILSHNYALPEGAVVEEVEIFTSTDFTSAGSPTFNLGTVDLDGTSNADADSLITEATMTELNTGGSNVAGWVGTLVGGAALTAAKLITWEVNTADFTAGSAVIRVYYQVP